MLGMCPETLAVLGAASEQMTSAIGADVLENSRAITSIAGSTEYRRKNPQGWSD